MSLTKVSYSMIDGAPVNVIDYGASPSASSLVNTAAINNAIADAISSGSRKVFFSAGGVYQVNALTNEDQVVFVGNNASFQSGISYTINELGGVAGKKATKYSVYAAVPRNDSVPVSSITRVGTVATVTVASTAGMNTGNYVSISGASQTAYNQTAYPTNITSTTFDMAVGGSPATPATGTILAHWWSMIDDSNHSPTGFASITTPDITTLRINYDINNGFGASKIGHFTVGVDDVLAPCGLIAGGDVGTTYANIKMAVPLSCAFTGGSATPNVPEFIDLPALLTGSMTVSNGGAGVRYLNHLAVPVGDVPVVSVRNYSATISKPKDIFITWTTTDVGISAVAPIAGFISFDGASWSQSLSDNLSSPTITYSAGVLRVTHNEPTSLADISIPMLTSFGGTYLVVATNIGLNFFEVGFYDFAGVKYAGAANTDMTFAYQRVNAKTLVEWPDDMAVTVQRGFYPVRTDDVWRVAGNNLWVSALMENL